MELLYIWIDSYKNIHRQGFNFSPKYRFEFNEQTLELTCTENKDFPKDFFGERISNVTAIVGENGSGKSSLLEFLCSNTYNLGSVGFSHFLDIKQIIVFCVESKIKVYSDYKLVNNNHTYSLIEKQEYKTLLWDKSTIIYYSNSLNINRNFKQVGENVYVEDFIDISTSYLINGIKPDITAPLDRIEIYKIGDTARQIAFILENDRKLLRMKLPDALEISLVESNIGLLNLARYNKLKEAVDAIESNKDLSFLTKAKKNIVYNHIIIQLFSQDFLDNYNKNNYEEKLQYFIDNDFDSAFNFFFNNSEKISSFISFLDKISQKDKIILNIDTDSSLIKEFTEKKIGGRFNLDWVYFKDNVFGHFSDGEQALLILYSRLYATIKELKQDFYKSKDLLLLIDEGELGLHPQWQKEYLKNLIDVLPQIFKDKKIQIILTSHSPFLVSDLPKENIIFLAKGEKGECVVKNSLHEMKQTFGANIHTLLTDSFFMQDKGLMGKFAEENINAVITWINEGNNKKINDLATSNHKTEIEIVQWLIKQIGEPIIRNQLQKMLDSRRLEKVETHDQKIADLENIVNSLQEQIKDLKSKK